MRNTFQQFASFFLTILLCTLGKSADAEVIVHSSNGYDVHISVVPIEIVTNTTNCLYGYTYQVKLSYTITFTGPNAPSSMYTLQGKVGCGSTSHFFDLPNGPASGTVNSATGWRDVSDCTSATVASLNCTEVKVQINGPGIPNQWVHIPSSTLPITLVSFDATVQGRAVRIDWTTASEQNNDFFTVERSADAMDFQPVLQVPGAGNSAQMLKYSTTDEDPLARISYYRLKQTDYDGHYSYSPTVVVVNSGNDGHRLSVSPNPGNARELVLPVNVIGNVLEIRSTTGMLVYTTTLLSNRITGPALSAGTYLLRVIDPLTGASEQCRMVRL